MATARFVISRRSIETDKAIMDVEVFDEGFVSGPLADVGSVIEVGHPMAFIVIDAAEVKMPMSIDAKAMIALETSGMIKLVADRATQKIIGVHFLADHTDTLIGAAVVGKAAAHG